MCVCCKATGRRSNGVFFVIKKEPNCASLPTAAGGGRRPRLASPPNAQRRAQNPLVRARKAHCCALSPRTVGTVYRLSRPAATSARYRRTSATSTSGGSLRGSHVSMRYRRPSPWRPRCCPAAPCAARRQVADVEDVKHDVGERQCAQAVAAAQHQAPCEQQAQVGAVLR